MSPRYLAILLILSVAFSAAHGASVSLTGCSEGTFRWLDVAGNEYAEAYQTAYDYTDNSVEVDVDYSVDDNVLQGTVTATNLKPNFAYQLKLEGLPGHADPVVRSANERIGMVGRYWREEWDGSDWGNGENLNSKGDGSRPSPNDVAYLLQRDDTVGGHARYRFTGYMVFCYFITGADGSASVSFSVDSSYHVLWKTSQRTRTASDGPVVSTTFDPETSSDAYDQDYGSSTVGIFGEWERLPVGGVPLLPGEYNCKILLTEESFHGSGLAGGWALAMHGEVSFTIPGVAWERPDGYLSPDTVAPGDCLYFEGDTGGVSFANSEIGVFGPLGGEPTAYTFSTIGAGPFDSLQEPCQVSLSPGGCYTFPSGPTGFYTLGLYDTTSGGEDLVDGSHQVELVPVAPSAGLVTFLAAFAVLTLRSSHMESGCA
jgi:hypothetical protein